ncbi:hypothetical protein V6Z12_D12G019000 [Gossypium hirsutum]
MLNIVRVENVANWTRMVNQNVESASAWTLGNRYVEQHGEGKKRPITATVAGVLPDRFKHDTKSQPTHIQHIQCMYCETYKSVQTKHTTQQNNQEAELRIIRK